MMKVVCSDALVKQNPCSSNEKRVCARARAQAQVPNDALASGLQAGA